ncbi:MAG: glutamate synthase-related protein, partial [Planctomycetota bacterium]|nr:glutamate synthase-related protein [Planctomycetota bacterium]
MDEPGQRGLYDPQNEHDGCGVGFLAYLHGQPAHELIEQGLVVLQNLLHRGAAGGDEATGDGAGLLFQRCDPFFRAVFESAGVRLPDAAFGVGMCFLPQDRHLREAIERLGERIAKEENLIFHGWRDVPFDPTVLGERARRECPVIRQCAISAPTANDPLALDRKLYVFRKSWEGRVRTEIGKSAPWHIASLSCRTVVYKGLMHAGQIALFYPDLHDPRLESALVVVHQRYSTNTFPSWRLAQPFRFLAHNGEINTIRGNRINMAMREPNLVSPIFGKDIEKLRPICEEDGSDSASLDNVLELLTLAGRDIAHAALMLIPQGWGKKYPMGPDLRGFFEYHSGLMEPWDGPAAVAFSDGRYVGGLLDRNGLRPARYSITRHGLVLFASEAGVLDLPAEELIETGSLRPGQMILVDLQDKRLMKDREIKMRLARRQPYRRWVEENRIEIYNPFETAAPPPADRLAYRKLQRLFGYSREDERLILMPMALEGEEPKGSMGNDTPLAVLSEQPQMLYAYFRQMFAQVTNPAIDPIREEAVMSLMTRIGNSDSILTETPSHARLIRLPHPFLSNEGLARLRSLPYPDFQATTLKAVFAACDKGAALAAALEDLCARAIKAVQGGSRILVLSDRPEGENEAPLPMLLAIAAVHHRLIEAGLRCRVGLVAETGEARDVHHMALLLGYGASAINPWFAYEILAAMAADQAFPRALSAVEAVANYIQALCKGLLKIMSKMGISTLRSYRSAQIFEAIGLQKALVDRYFVGTPTRIEGIGLDEIAREINMRVAAAQAATSPTQPLPSGGRFHFRRDGERHLWTPESIVLLQRSTRENRPDLYEQFARLINEQAQRPTTLRGLFKLRSLGTPVPLDEVEPAENIIRRFVTSAMSFGSISPEAHETIAIAMNRLGAQSNCGEGGEDPRRYRPGPNGENLCSAVKQVASGRFGVTIEYLVNARELQIKIAQGAKPGEGGHLPGHKVNA